MSEPSSSFSGSVAHGVAWVSAAAFSVRVIGFLTSIFLLSSLSLHQYGTYQLVLSAAGLFALFTLQGIDEVILAAGAKLVGEKDVIGTRNLLRGYWVFKMFTGVLAWILVLFASEFFTRWYSDDILQLLKIYAGLFLLLPFERVILFSFAAHRQFRRSSLYGFVQELIKGIAIVIFLTIFHFGIEGIVFAMILSMMSTIVLFGAKPISELFRSLAQRSWRPFLTLLQSQGGWTIAQRLLRQGEKNIRPLVIQAMLGREAVALFSFAEKVYGYIAGIFPLGDVLMPSIAKESSDRERLQRVLERGIKYTVPFYTVIALLIGLSSPFVTQYIFPQYRSALPVLYAVLCYIPFVGLAYLMTSFFVSHQEQALQFRAICIRAGFFLLFLPVSLFFFDVIGAGVEFALTLMMYNVTRFFLLRQKYPELSLQASKLFKIDTYDRALFQRLRQKAYATLRMK